MPTRNFLRYPLAAIKHPSLISYAVSHRGYQELVRKWTELEMEKPAMIEMKRLASSKEKQTFTLDGEDYTYLCANYNYTWCNERAVEIPIAWRAVSQYRDCKILEVGNVLSHYFPVSHMVVDKHEKAPNVLNEDIIDFSSEEKFDLIVSISTLEHVGWKEKPKDTTKVVKAVLNLKSMLADRGKLIMTAPWGWNPEFDKHVSNKTLGLTSTSFMRRTSFDNTWEECDFSQLRKTAYGHSYPNVVRDQPPFPHANGILIGTVASGR